MCDDIDECQGPPDNGGCTANSHCHNTRVRVTAALIFPFKPVDYRPEMKPGPVFVVSPRVHSVVGSVRVASLGTR